MLLGHLVSCGLIAHNLLFVIDCLEFSRFLVIFAITLLFHDANIDKISIRTSDFIEFFQYLSMRIIDRLDKYMSYSGLNDNKVTISCGLSVGLLGKARRGDSDLGKKAIDKILTFYQNLNRVWLVTGEGPMLKDSPISIDEEPTQTTNDMTIDRLLNALERRDEELAHRGRQMDELIHQQSRLISVIEEVTGTTFRKSHAG